MDDLLLLGSGQREERRRRAPACYCRVCVCTLHWTRLQGAPLEGWTSTSPWHLTGAQTTVHHLLQGCWRDSPLVWGTPHVALQWVREAAVRAGPRCGGPHPVHTGKSRMCCTRVMDWARCSDGGMLRSVRKVHGHRWQRVSYKTRAPPRNSVGWGWSYHTG
jgi:hypothetical protein